MPDTVEAVGAGLNLGGPNSLDRSKAQLSETLLQSAVH
jgi:hypothetical protein